MTRASFIQGLGLMGLIASTFNCTVGGGIFRLPWSVYQIAGTASPWVYLICFLIMFLVVTVFIQVGKSIQSTGGPYAYVRPVLGKYPAFICGVLLWALATFAMASVAVAFAGFVAQPLSDVAPGLGTPTGQASILGLTFAALGWINTHGVRSGSIVSIFLSIAKLLPLVILVAVGIPHLTPEVVIPPPPTDSAALARGALILIFAFTGVESALIPSGEIKDPERTLPRALYSALFLVLFLYLGLQWVTQSQSQALQNPSGNLSPLAVAAGNLMGPSGIVLLSLGAILSTLGYLSAITLSLPRSLFSFAEDGYLPVALAKIDAVSKTPKNAIWTQVFLGWLLAVSSQFEKLAVLSNISAILMYMICAVAALKLGRRWAPSLALVAMGVLLFAVSGSEWVTAGIVIGGASLLYLLKSRSQNLGTR